MTSPETSAPLEWLNDQTPTSFAARYAAAGFLALAAMLFLGGGGTSALHAIVSRAGTHTAALDIDLAHMDSTLGALNADGGQGVSDEVADAVDAARAATAAAESALAGVGDATADEARTVLDLSDAQVALEAASAQVRHVRGQVDGSTNGSVDQALASIQSHLDALRLPPTSD